MAKAKFELEALLAHAGDALLLHYGDSKGSGLMVIDGGPAKTYGPALRPRLQELGGGGQTKINLMMVSHIDDDHIHGILELMEECSEAQEDDNPLPFVIDTLWHNSFDEIVGNSEVASFGATTLASLSDAGMPGLVPEEEGGAVLASVGQGRKLRLAAKTLGIVVNKPFGALVESRAPGDQPVPFGHGLTFRVIAPLKNRLKDLQKEWDKELEKIKKKEATPASLAAFVDNSVFNLSSIVVLAQMGTKRMLLTGDARGDDIIKGLAEAGLLKDGGIDLDLLKMPHHGSDRNVSTDFFRSVRAQHYVFSGDGKHDNPEIGTLEMIAEARKGKQIDLHFTYKLADRHKFLVENAPEFKLHYPKAGAKSVTVSL